MPIYLYVKTHNKTGLKYLGKTTSSDPHKYPGSGKYWTRHLQKYGYDYSTEIIKECETIDEIREWGLYYSKLWNVAENNEWANLILEQGEGLDSESAKISTTNYHKNLSEFERRKRSENCSKGQKERFKKNPESKLTKTRKSDAHKGSYRIESPEGKIWETSMGLKDFANQYKDELNVTYWQLFGAYRKCYNNKVVSKKRKDNNNWRVTRLDK